MDVFRPRRAGCHCANVGTQRPATRPPKTPRSSSLTCVSLSRISRRIKLGSWRALGIEDYLMVFALVNLAGVCFSINEVAANGSSYLPPDQVENLTDEGRKMAIYGSIMTFVLEIFTITGLWTVKTCLLLLYARITYVRALTDDWNMPLTFPQKGRSRERILCREMRWRILPCFISSRHAVILILLVPSHIRILGSTLHPR